MNHPITLRPRRLTFNMRVRIILLLFVVGAVLSFSVAYASYRLTSDNLFLQLQKRVLSIAQVGALSIDPDAFGRLSDAFMRAAGPPSTETAENSADYKLVSDELNRIRNVDGRLIRYVYTFRSTGDPDHALYVVDADVLALHARQKAGETISADEISDYGSDFDITDFPVARDVLTTGQAMVERSYAYDEVFKVNSVSGYAPIRSRDGSRVLGVLGLDMTDADVRSVLKVVALTSILIAAGALLITSLVAVFLGTLFTRGIEDLERAVKGFSERNLDVRVRVRTNDEVGRLGTSFNRMAEIIQDYSKKQEALLRAYGRFVPHDFLKFLEKTSILDVGLGDQVQRDMTVLFSDIRSFTSLSESMSPRENFNFLNSYLSRVGPEIRAFGGFIDKYIGDAIMALFPDDPADAVRSGIAMQTRLKEYNRHRANSGYAPISVGVGIHAGTLMLGTIGEDERMDGSVISDTVNLCSRLEALTRFYGVSILISDRTLSLLQNRGDFLYRYVDRVQVRGRSQAVLIYEIFNADAEHIRAYKNETKGQWNLAMRDYFPHRRFESCFERLGPLVERCPEDVVAQIYRDRCDQLIKYGVPDGWKGVEYIDMK